MSNQGNVAELIDGETHHAYMWNEKNMHYYTNNSGGSVTSGDVVVLDTSGAERFKTSTTPGDVAVLGVIPQKDDVNGTAADQTIANGAAGAVQFAGDVAKINVDAATAIGNYLIASGTAKKAHPVAAWQVGVFAVATSASAGAGTVSAKLFPALNVVHAGLADKGTNAHAAIDTHLAATAAAHGLPASVNFFGNRTAAGAFVQYGYVASISDGGVVNFPFAFPTACDVVFLAPISNVLTIGPESLDTGHFHVRCTGAGAIYWIAIGH